MWRRGSSEDANSLPQRPRVWEAGKRKMCLTEAFEWRGGMKERTSDLPALSFAIYAQHWLYGRMIDQLRSWSHKGRGNE